MEWLFKKIGLVARHSKPEVVQSLLELARHLEQQGLHVFIDRDSVTRAEAQGLTLIDRTDFGKIVDVAIVLGGDGTMLSVARLLAPYRIPLIGINQGRLGFMTDIPLHTMIASVSSILQGEFLPEERMLLQSSVMRDNVEVAQHLALNDIVINRGAMGQMIEFEIFVDNQFVYSQRADGLVVASPTGSTAYALSSGGPILHPTLTGIALVPLCPHALTNRPIIVDDKADIELRIITADDPRVHFDGQVTLDLQRDDCVRLRRSEYTICFLHPPGYSYFAMLRQKLHWSARPRGH